MLNESTLLNNNSPIHCLTDVCLIDVFVFKSGMHQIFPQPWTLAGSFRILSCRIFCQTVLKVVYLWNFFYFEIVHNHSWLNIYCVNFFCLIIYWRNYRYELLMSKLSVLRMRKLETSSEVTNKSQGWLRRCVNLRFSLFRFRHGW